MRKRKICPSFTAAIAGFYTEDSSLYLAYAGHEPLWLSRQSSDAWQPVALDETSTACPNAPLGVVPDACFDQQRIVLATGDRLLLHTDGLTEAMDAAGEQFGAERLQRALEDAAGGSLASIKRSVLGAVARHTGDAPPKDDVTLLVVEVS